MTIGLPRALEYHRSQVFWTSFLGHLGLCTTISPPTNRHILGRGAALSVDESCLSYKIFLGHVDYLASRCDKVLIPRLETLTDSDSVCVKFFALSDTVKAIIGSDKVIDYNINHALGLSERKAYFELGYKLGYKRSLIASAISYAQSKDATNRTHLRQIALSKCLITSKTKVLIVGHPYNIYDRMVGIPIIDALSKLDITDILACELGSNPALSKKLSDTVYWSQSKELLAAIAEVRPRIDGIVLVTSFPCGPDALVNELILLKIRNLPILNLVVDEHTSLTGLQTRIESFADMLQGLKEYNAAEVTA